MRLREDCSALESLPLKLMIVAVVVSLSIVPAAEALGNLRNRDFVNRAEGQVRLIASSAQELMMEGPGGVRTVSLDFTGGGSLKFECITIGDRKGGPNMSAIVLSLRNGGRIIETVDDPPTWLRGPAGEPMETRTPSFELRLTCVLEGRSAYILTEVV